MPSFQFNLSADNNPTQLTGNTTIFRSCTVWAYSGFSASGTPINNNATIYMGTESGKLPMVTAGGAAFNLNYYTVQEYDNFQRYYVMGKNLDGLYVIYT